MHSNDGQVCEYYYSYCKRAKDRTEDGRKQRLSMIYRFKIFLRNFKNFDNNAIL